MDLPVCLAQQLLFDQAVDPLLNDGGQLVLAPLQEQLALQVRINAHDQTFDLFAFHAWIVLEQAGDQRRQDHQVQHVVAVVGHQHRLGLVQTHDFAKGIGLAADHLHGLYVFDHRLAVQSGQGHARAVGDCLQQRLVAVQCPCQGCFVQRQTGGGQHHQGDQVDRVDVGCGADAAGQLACQGVGGGVQPTWTVVGGQRLLSPAWLLAIKKVRQGQRLAKVHRDLAKTQLERRKHPKQVKHRLLLLRLPTQLAQVGAAFQHPLITDIHRHKHDRATRGTQEAAQGDRQHAGLGAEHAAGA